MESYQTFKLLLDNKKKSLQTRTDHISKKMAVPNSTFTISGRAPQTV